MLPLPSARSALLARTAVPCLLVVVALLSPRADAATITYTDRAAFEATLGVVQLEDYAGIPNGIYGTGLDALLGPGVPIHRSTAGAVDNQVFQEIYNATNASFRITFTNLSLLSSAGVFGIGFDYSQSIDQWEAFVTYADGGTEEFDLVLSGFPNFEFFGITSDRLIRDVHVSRPGGMAGIANAVFFLDDLTWSIGPMVVPEPATFALVGLGLLALGRRGRASRPVGDG